MGTIKLKIKNHKYYYQEQRMLARFSLSLMRQINAAIKTPVYVLFHILR